MIGLIRSCVVGLLALAASACARLDGDDVSDLAEEIRDLPAATQSTIAANKRNDRLIEAIRSRRDKFGSIGMVVCKEGTPAPLRDKALPLDKTVTKDYVVQWLSSNPGAGLPELLAHLLDMFPPGLLRDGAAYGNPPCTPVLRHAPGWSFDEIQSEVDALAESGDEPTDSAFWLPTVTLAELKSRPGLLAALGLVIVGGLVVAPVTPIGLVLCPKSTAIQCPDDPTRAGEEQPATSEPSEGDR